MERLEVFAYRTVATVHFTDQNCIWCVIVCKVSFTNWNAKIELLRASTVVTYYIKLLRTGADRHNGILMFTASSRREKKVVSSSFGNDFGKRWGKEPILNKVLTTTWLIPYRLFVIIVNMTHELESILLTLLCYITTLLKPSKFKF